MRKSLVAFGGSLFILAGCAAATDGGVVAEQAGASTSGAAAMPVLRRWIVVTKQDHLDEGESAVARTGGHALSALRELGVTSAVGDDAFAAAAAQDPAVEAVGLEPFYALPEVLVAPSGDAQADARGDAAEGSSAPTAADDLYALQWNLRRVRAPGAWARLPLNVQRRATVAVIDSGVLDTHPDLAGAVVDRVATNLCPETDGSSPSSPRYTLRVDLEKNPGWQPGDPCEPAPNVRYDQHGTHVAGIIGARFGGGRVVGVGPGLSIAAYKVFDRIVIPTSNGPTEVFAAAQSSVFAAVADAVAKGYPVINLSLGSAVDRTTEAGRARYEAWARLARHARRHGTLLVGAAGNEATRSSETARTLPGDLPTVVGVSATGTDALSVADGNLVASGADVLAPYSNCGEPVDLAAPGGDCGPVAGACDPRHLILSTIVRPDGTPGYGFAGGTSMAAPHVAAAAGLVFAAGRRLPVDFGAAYVLLTAERLGPAEKFGRGMVDVEKAAIPASLALPRRLELPAGLAQRGAAADPG